MTLELVSVIGMILLGLLLIMLEIIVIPGTTIVGIIGGIMMFAGIFWMYEDFGSKAGNYTVVATVLVTSLCVYFSLKAKVWKRFMLNETMEGRANIVDAEKVKPGDTGVAISRLRPMGTVLVNNIRIEAHTNGEGIEENTEIVVTKVMQNKIIVKAKQG